MPVLLSHRNQSIDAGIDAGTKTCARISFLINLQAFSLNESLSSESIELKVVDKVNPLTSNVPLI